MPLPGPRHSSPSCRKCWQLTSLSFVPLWSFCLQMESSLTPKVMSPSSGEPISMTGGCQRKMDSTYKWDNAEGLTVSASELPSGLAKAFAASYLPVQSCAPSPTCVNTENTLQWLYTDIFREWISSEVWPMTSAQCHVTLGMFSHLGSFNFHNSILSHWGNWGWTVTCPRFLSR